MVKQELRVASCELRVEGKKHELKFKSANWNSNPRVTSFNPRVTSSNPPVQGSFTSYSLIIAS